MKWKQILLIVLISSASAFISVWGYSKWARNTSSSRSNGFNLPVNYAGFFDKSDKNEGVSDFTNAANAAVPAVVHIKTKIEAKTVTRSFGFPKGNSLFDDFFGDMFGPQVLQEQRASGSGVIITQDGYIVTNNHVISDGEDGVADDIKVTLHNGKTYDAKLIGRDPSTDLAVLKIKDTGLPFLVYGNSESLMLGQWVLAIGYPLNLETTVTAGIISALGRGTNLTRRQSSNPVESFIQTDAAVNQGNSGGALVNTQGQLIGINSQILAPSGTYAGYSFAIPANLVKKVVEDIIEFGDVQRPFLGITTKIQDDENSEIPTTGAYVDQVADGGAAKKAGLKHGDVIVKIDDFDIKTWNDLMGKVASSKIGDKIKLEYIREGKRYSTYATLTEKPKGIDNIYSNTLNDKLGAKLETIDDKTASDNDIRGGVKVTNIKQGGLIAKSRMENNFIITGVSGRSISSVEDLIQILNQASGTVRLEGVYPGYDGVYSYPLPISK